MESEGDTSLRRLYRKEVPLSDVCPNISERGTSLRRLYMKEVPLSDVCPNNLLFIFIFLFSDGQHNYRLPHPGPRVPRGDVTRQGVALIDLESLVD